MNELYLLEWTDTEKSREVCGIWAALVLPGVSPFMPCSSVYLVPEVRLLFLFFSSFNLSFTFCGRRESPLLSIGQLQSDCNKLTNQKETIRGLRTQSTACSKVKVKVSVLFLSNILCVQVRKLGASLRKSTKTSDLQNLQNRYQCHSEQASRSFVIPRRDIDEHRMVLGGQPTPFCFYPLSRVTRNCETRRHQQLRI